MIARRHVMARSLSELFLSQPALHILRGGFLDTSCRSRDRVPLITGFSSIRSWVTQPRLGLLDFRQVPNGHEEDALLFSSRAQSNPSPASSSNTQSPGQVLRTFNHVRIQPRGPVDALLCHGRGYQEVEGGKIPDRRSLTLAARPRAGRPYS